MNRKEPPLMRIMIIFFTVLIIVAWTIKAANEAKTVSYIERGDVIPYSDRRDLKRIIKGTWRYHDGVYYKVQ